MPKTIHAILITLLLTACNGNGENTNNPEPPTKSKLVLEETTFPLEIVSLREARRIVRGKPDGRAFFVQFPHSRYQYWALSAGWRILFLDSENTIAEIHFTSTGGGTGINSEREYAKTVLLPLESPAKIDAKVTFKDLPATLPKSGLEKLKIGSHTVYFERSESDEERQDGLMWRRHMSENDGMMFFYPEPDWKRFWMGNCLLNLDIAFFRADRTLINVVEMDRYPDPTEDPGDRAASEEETKYVLEMNQGWFRKRNLTDEEGRPVGTVQFEILP